MSKLVPAPLDGKSYLNLGTNGLPQGNSLEAEIKKAKQAHHEAKQHLDSLLLKRDLAKSDKPIVTPSKVTTQVKRPDLRKFKGSK